MPTVSEYLLRQEPDTGAGNEQPPRGAGTIEQYLLTPQPADLRAAPGPRGLYPEPDVPTPGLTETYGPTALRLIGGPAGFAIGTAAMPLAGPAAPYVGGALGAAAGEMGARALAGEPQQLFPTLVAGAGGAINPAPTGRMAETAAREALINLGLTSASRLASGELPSGKDVPFALALGGLGGMAAHALNRPPTEPLPQRTAENPLPNPLFRNLPEGQAGPPAPTPFTRIEEPRPLALPQEAPFSPLPSLRTQAGERLSPLVGRPPEIPEPHLLGPRGEPLAGAQAEAVPLLAPGPAPNPSARIVQPSGEPFPADSEGVLRGLLQRRGLPEEEINRIVAQTAPPPSTLPVDLAQPGAPIAGERTAGQALLAQEGMADLQPGVLQAVRRGGPPEQGPLVLPFRKGEEAQLGPISPLRDTMTAQLDALTAEPLTAAMPKSKPGMQQQMRAADILAENAEIAQVTDLRRQFPSLEQAAEHAYSIMDSDPIRARDILNAVDIAAADRRFSRLFNENRSLSEILATQATSEAGGTVNPLITAGARAGVGGLIGGTQGDTPQERLRNAAIGAGVGALASPALLSRLLRGAPTEAAPTAAETAVKDLGIAARKIELGAETGDYRLAHSVADDAEKQIDRIVEHVHEITPDNRLFKVVADTLMTEGADKARNLETVSGAARVLQRYSALAQKLQAMQAAGDQEAGQLLRTLYGADQGGMVRQVMDFWRASLVGKVSTGLRNAYDQGTVVVTGALDKLMAGVVEGIRTGHPFRGAAQGAQEAYQLGAAAARRAWQGTAAFMHLAATEPDVLARALDAYPEQTAKLLAKPEGLGGITHEYLQKVNAVNTVQEIFFRKVWAEAEIRNDLGRLGVNADEAFRTPSMIPENVMSKAVDRALVGTFQNSPKGQLAKDVVGLFADHPVLHAILPFPRYISNRIQYIVDHNPLALVRLFTQGQQRAGLQATIADNQAIIDALSRAGETVGAAKAAFNVNRATSQLNLMDTPSEIVGKWLSGLTLIGAGLALRESPIAGEHWYEVKPSPGSDQRIDMRPFSTLAGFMFAGELAKQMATGGVKMSQDDMTQGIALAGTRSGVGLTLVDLASGRGNTSFDGVMNLAADLAGMFGAGFLNPLSQAKDLAALADPGQATMRETRDTPAMRAYGPTMNQVPYLRDLLPASPSGTSAKNKEIEQPLAHFLGVNVATRSPLEQEIARLGIPTATVNPREQDKANQRALTRGQGEILGAQGQAVIDNPKYQTLSPPEQRMVLGRIITGARNRALSELPRETIADILLRRKPKDLQEIINQRRGQ